MKMRLMKLGFIFLVVGLSVSTIALAAPPEDQPVAIQTSSGDGPIKIGEGVVIERITSLPRMPGDSVDFEIGLQRITVEPGATFDLVPLLGYGYAGPVQFYVEHGVMTIESWTGKAYSTHGDAGQASGGTIPHDLPEGDAVYAPDGKIGPVHNNGDEPLVMLAIILVPDEPYQ